MARNGLNTLLGSPAQARAFWVGVKKVLASVATFALGFGMLVMGTTTATAASGEQNTNVAVSDLVLADQDGNPLTEQITVGDEFTIKGKWDAKDANPQPGETFVIGLPPEFNFVMGGPPIKLNGVDDATGETVTWAECTADNKVGPLTCVFTNAVTDRDEIHGDFTLDITAVGVTDQKTVNFDLNGTEVPVELPGEGGIDDGIVLPEEVTKSGWMNDNNWSMTWRIDIPGASLVSAGDDVAHITDTLGAGHQLCDPFELKVETVRGDTVIDVSDLADITQGASGDRSFAFDLNAPEGGFDPGVTYRVQYQTCTPDGQIPESQTEFSNEAQIEGWGEAGEGVGTVTSKPWHQDISKSGSVLGGTERNGKIRWTVTVPGNLVAGKDSFTITETLGDGHEVGTDTISGIKVIEQYGPNPGNAPGKRQDITANLDATDITTSGSSFKVTLGIKSDSDQTFKDSDWRYIVTYDTYVSSEELPEGGTEYTNSVNVDGSVTSGTAKVPEREYKKNGKLNNTAKTLDGVEHSPFTTLDWTVIIPGEIVDDLDKVELTDVLSDTHEVCQAGDSTEGLSARLGVNVQVRDQISNGGKTPNPNNLTAQTQATVDGQTVTFTIEQPDDNKFSRDYQYVVSYTTCTASGGIDARGTEYTNEIKGSGVDRSGKVRMEYSGSGTGTGVARGSIDVTKLVTGSGADLVPEGTTFDVKVEEFAPGATSPEKAYTLAVPVNGDPVKGLNQRGKGWTIRLSEPTFPNVPGVTFGTPQFAKAEGLEVSEDGTVATATITPLTNVAVELTNTAKLGQMTVTKQLDGTAADQVSTEKEYSFTATIDVSDLAGVPAQDDRVFTLKSGEAETLKNIPIGATVTVSEIQPVDDDVFTWDEPTVSPNPVIISPDNVDTPATVTVTNSVSRTVGSFSLNKKVTGAQAENPAVPETVTVTATWQQEGETTPTSKVIELPTDGSSVDFGEQLLIGTEVTLTETPLADGSSIAWGAPTWSGTGVSQGTENSAIVTIGRDAEAVVNLENHAATSTAGISLLKIVSGEATADVPEDAEFPVTATWVDGEGGTQSRDITINTAEPTPLGIELPAGTVVTITEGDSPAIDTVVWESITISGNDVTDMGDGTAQVTVSDQQDTVTLVSITNETEWADGTFSLSKQIDGLDPRDVDYPDAVEVVASWYETDESGLTEHVRKLSIPTDGSTVDFGSHLPAFTEVTLSEIPPEDTDRFSWSTPSWVSDGALVAHEDGTATLTVQPAGAHEVTLQNTAETNVGSVELTKILSGNAQSAVSSDAIFTVTVEWTDLMGEKQNREVTVSPDTSTLIPGLPFGTEVTFTEVKPQNPQNARWVAAAWSVDDQRVNISPQGDTVDVTMTGENDTPIKLVLDNKYETVESLSVTGSTLTGLIAISITLLGLGGVALAVRNRRAGA